MNARNVIVILWWIKMLNKQKGNMYPWVTHTWNPIKGKCPHDCSYCYMKRFPQPKLHLDEKELKTDLGKGNFIFVGSSCDIFADGVNIIWVHNVLEHCYNFDNTYLFQSKNPYRFINLIGAFPEKTILGTTIETNRNFEIGNAPNSYARKCFMMELRTYDINYKRMVSIEPILDFDLDIFVKWIQEIKPEFVSIGADSKGHNLPEPSWDKVQALIKELRKFTEVKIKDNLKRLKN